MFIFDIETTIRLGLISVVFSLTMGALIGIYILLDHIVRTIKSWFTR